MIFTEDFRRFTGGCIYTITFDQDGNVSRASIYVGGPDGDVDVTGAVQNSSYWERKIMERLEEIKSTAGERKGWQKAKDLRIVSGE